MSQNAPSTAEAARRPDESPGTRPAAPPHAVRSPGWHARPAEEALRQLGTGLAGLAAAEAGRRLATHGPNRLPAGGRRSALARLLAQFHNLLIYVLLAAALVTAALGHPVDTAVILLVVLINAAIGYVQEGRAEEALDAIREMIAPRASVLRDGRRLTVDAAEIVPGDVVLLEAGDRVPADLRLARVRSLRIDEAILTGESVSAEKAPAPVAHDAPLGDRASMAFSGTMVTGGQGTGVVVATGADTEIGRISALIGQVETLETPLVRRMNRFARQLSLIILAVSAGVFLVAVLLRGYAWGDAFMAVVGLAVAAIPEGLPAVMTITLAIGVRRMAARQAIIRRLPAVETLGSVSTICSDKTGTLTRNEMTVRSVVTADGTLAVSGVGYEPRGAFSRGDRAVDPDAEPGLRELALAALLCNDAGLRQTGSGWAVDGDPMEGALLSFAVKAGHDAGLERRQLPRTDEIPFDAQHRFMATLHHRHDGSAFACVKGAPERLLAMCRRQRVRGADAPLDRAHWEERIEALARGGQRVLAVATRPMPAGTRDLRFADVERDLTLWGRLGLSDPPRDEAIAAVRACREAGIGVKMITGDHASTASAIAAQLGLEAPHAAATGQDLEGMPEAELRRLAAATSVFARTSPEHKLRLVEALQAEGAVVAMTGDGVNDAPALKRADVGVAMGRKGTEAAKEAAEMVLADDNFASIVAAVREGRTVYDNLTKVIGWTLPTNGGEAVAVIGAILLGLTLPLTPVQILWINMVTAAGLGLTLAFEPTEPDVMRRPPRAIGEPLLSGFIWWRIALVSVLFAIGVFGVFSWSVARGGTVEAARTLVVDTMVVMEIAYLFSVRYLNLPSLTLQGLVGTPAVLLGVGAVVLAQLAFTYLPPLQRMLDTRPLGLTEGLVAIGVGVLFFAVLELEKLARRGSWLPRGLRHQEG
jgi:magnesium-transporting ATPase (P-type)